MLRTLVPTLERTLLYISFEIIDFIAFNQETPHRATTMDCPYKQRFTVGAIPCGCPCV